MLDLWRSIICKHNARWLHVSQLKAGVVNYSIWKTCIVNKTCQLKPGKGAGIWWTMKPHCLLPMWNKQAYIKPIVIFPNKAKAYLSVAIAIYSQEFTVLYYNRLTFLATDEHASSLDTTTKKFKWLNTGRGWRPSSTWRPWRRGPQPQPSTWCPSYKTFFLKHWRWDKISRTIIFF